MTEADISSYITEYGKRARHASGILACAPSALKNAALLKAAELLIRNTDSILKANEDDIRAAAQKGMSVSMQDRLRLNANRIASMAEGLRQIAALEDPIGAVIGGGVRPNGLEIIKKRVPLGVIGIIYEARPNVTADAAGLCIKSGNACILRGGSEALKSNMAIASLLSEALSEAGLSGDSVQLIDNTDRAIASAMMRLDKYIDVLIPRGGAGLIRTVTEKATIPVIRTGTGNCHIYVDDEYDREMALNIIINAKTQRPSVCNAAETLLVCKSAACDFLPGAAQALIDRGTELRCSSGVLHILEEAGLGTPETNIMLREASSEDWDTEYNDLILTVGTVSDVNEAIAHINAHGTGHSEAIVTNNYAHARIFQERVDAACVYVNASTRFTDGYEFGFGAEIGISNQKLHARGPMGLTELTTVKYIINGSGQLRG